MADSPVRKPAWLRVNLQTSESFAQVRRQIRTGKLNTVCEEARCPNIYECWGVHKTATFMILGSVCTRRCRFCAVATGLPTEMDEAEPARVAESVAQMGLRHAVVTMVARDDLRDGGAGVLADTVEQIHARVPGCRVEVLASDFNASRQAIATLVASRPEIVSHNMETVPRLTPLVRSHSTYETSLSFLRIARELAPTRVTKSSLMVGLGETTAEIHGVMDDLRSVGVDMLNIGQYLQPTRTHVAVARYWHPDEFEELKATAQEKGFSHCESGPFVRSSYHAEEQFSCVSPTAEQTGSSTR